MCICALEQTTSHLDHLASRLNNHSTEWHKLGIVGKYIAQAFQLYQEPAKWWLVRSPTKSINLVPQIRERMTKLKMEEQKKETYLSFKLFIIFNCCLVMFELCLWVIILELFYFYAFRRFCNILELDFWHLGVFI